MNQLRIFAALARPGWVRLLWLAFALLSAVLIAAAPARAETPKFTVHWTPLKMHFRVYPNGRITGLRTADVAVSRTQKPSGVFQSCKKVYTLEVAQVAVKDAKEQDTTMARKELRPGLCNFKNVHLHVTPFTNDELTQACHGSSHTLHKQAKVIFWDNYYPDRDKYYNQFDKTYGKANDDDYFTFTALVECGGPKGHPANPSPATGTGGGRWHPPVVGHPVGRPVNPPGGVHINPPNVGTHIECLVTGPGPGPERLSDTGDPSEQPYAPVLLLRRRSAPRQLRAGSAGAERAPLPVRREDGFLLSLVFAVSTRPGTHRAASPDRQSPGTEQLKRCNTSCTKNFFARPWRFWRSPWAAPRAPVHPTRRSSNTPNPNRVRLPRPWLL
ncbi:MAG: hypothetical protein P8009_09150 [Gammaproteobacteria bacterium]